MKTAIALALLLLISGCGEYEEYPTSIFGISLESRISDNPLYGCVGFPIKGNVLLDKCYLDNDDGVDFEVLLERTRMGISTT